MKIAVLCSFNLDLVKRPLAEALSSECLSPDLYFTGYGLWETESIDPQSALHRFAPQVVILFADAADQSPPRHPGIWLPTRAEAQAAGAASWQRLQTTANALLANLP